MLGVVLLSLLLTTIVVVCLGAAMFWDVAFCNAGRPGSSSRAPEEGRVPAACDGVNLALRVERAVGRLVQRLGSTPPATDACEPACGDREIHVTTPEVLAIVHELRERLPADRVDAIQVQARHNLATPEGSRHCPLRLSSGACACAAARPVSCRTRCLVGVNSHLDDRQLADSIGAGATEIMRDCLNASGLDDSEYELNQALIQVLDTPHAAYRWARGERILESASSCRA